MTHPPCAPSQNASAVFAYVRKEIVPTLVSESGNFPPPSSATGSGAIAGYDLTSEFLSVVEDVTLAQAQECFWHRAVIEKYKNAIIARLAIKVSEYYDSALRGMTEGTAGIGQYFPSVSKNALYADLDDNLLLPLRTPFQAFKSHLEVKKLHFLAAAHYRMSQDDLERARYGDEIARLRLAEAAVKRALDIAKAGGVSASVAADLKSLSGILAANLQRAVRDNDLVYVSPIPPESQLSKIQPAPMVKQTLPSEIEHSLDWILKQGGTLFAALVPYGVHVALSELSFQNGCQD